MNFTMPLMDLVDIEGIRSNQVIGYGLVVGLDGSGDKNQVKFTNQSVAMCRMPPTFSLLRTSSAKDAWTMRRLW